MAILFKGDVLKRLKDAGYPTTKLREKKLLNESVIQHLRKGESISFNSLNNVCKLLKCQPGDLIAYVEDEPSPEEWTSTNGWTRADLDESYQYEYWLANIKKPGQFLSDFIKTDLSHIHAPEGYDLPPKAKKQD